MCKFLLRNNSNCSHFEDTANDVKSKMTEFACLVKFNFPAKGIKWYGHNINMTVHVKFANPICVPSFIPVHWLAFAVCMFMPKNYKKKMTTTMTKKWPVPSIRIYSALACSVIIVAQTPIIRHNLATPVQALWPMPCKMSCTIQWLTRSVI